MKNQNGKSILVILLLVVVIAAGGWFFLRGKGTIGKIASLPKQEVNLSGTIVDQLPPTTFGFAYIDFAHPAYKRYLASQWGADKSSPLGMEAVLGAADNGNGDVKGIVGALKTAGLDLNDPNAIGAAYSKVVLFGAKSGSNGSDLGGGGLLQANNANSLAQQMNAIRTSVTQDGDTVTDLQVAGGLGFAVETKPRAATVPGQPERTPTKTYFGWAGDRAVVASSADLVTQVLGSSRASLPLLADPDFKKLTTGLAGDNSRYGTWFVDLKPILSAGQGAQLNPGDATKAFYAIGGSFSMSDVPSLEARIGYNKEDAAVKKILTGLSVSTAKEVVSPFNTSPMTFVSIDGSLLRNTRVFLEETHKEDAASVINYLKSLDAVTRIGLGVRMAPVGASLLPIPDVMLTAPSSDVTQTQSALVSFADSLAHLDKTEKTIAGKQVTVLRGVGVGVLIAATDNMVVASTSEPQLEKYLQSGSKEGSFANQVSGRAGDLLLGEPSLTNIYLNFNELGSFLENMGGMLSMYAPQSDEAKSLLDKNNLARLKKMGSLTTAVTLDDAEGLLRLESTYGTAS